MASHPDRRVGNLLQELGHEGDGIVTFEESLTLARPLKLEPTKDLRPFISNRLPGQLKAVHLPISQSRATKLHQWVEIMPDWEGKFEKDAVEGLLATNQYSKLPEPFKLKGSLLAPHTIDFFVVHSEEGKLATEDGKKMVLKLVKGYSKMQKLLSRRLVG